MSTGLRKQDGEAVAFLVLISPKKEDKEHDLSPEESYVVTKDFFLVETIERKHKLETRSGGQDDER